MITLKISQRTNFIGFILRYKNTNHVSTYIGNIRYEDHLPSHLDICKLVCEPWFDIEHFDHKGHIGCKDPDIGYLCKLYCQGSRCHADIPLFGLKKKYIVNMYLPKIPNQLCINLNYCDILLGTHNE